MSEPPIIQPPEPSDDLQFATVEPAVAGTAPAAQAAAAPSCAICHQPIRDAYFSVGDKLVCPDCRGRYARANGSGSPFGRFAKASAFGVVAGIVGALIWWGVRGITHANWGIVAVVVGFLVGGAVRAGSGGRGGRAYQILAVLLTYLAIAGSYVPELYEILRGRAPQPAVVETVIIIAIKAPILLGLKSIIGLFITGFALWEAWKINTRRHVDFTGPYSLGGGAGVLPLPNPAGLQP